MKFWKWFLTVYAIYFFIYMVVWITGEGFFNGFFLLFQQIGNAVAIFSTISLLEKRKFKLSFFRWIILSYYFFFTLVSSVMVGFAAFNSLSIYDPYSVVSLIDILGFSLPIIAIYPVVKTFTDFNFRRLPKILWFGYLWILIILMSCFIAGSIIEITKWKFYDYLVMLTAALFIITNVSYVLKIKFFSTLFWKIYFWISIIWGILDSVYYLALKSYVERPELLRSYIPDTELPILIYWIFLIIFAPTYYTFYKIVFDKKYFKKN